MARLEILPFSDEHTGGAAALLAERHRRHRLSEPLLPARFEDPAAARGEIEAAWRRDGASGAIAVEEGRLAGYLIGAPRPESVWGANVWVELAGHAVREPELARDLYGAAAGPWVEAGGTRHYVIVPAFDASLVDAWFRVGFGAQHVHAIRELCDQPVPSVSPVQVAQAEERDVDDLLELTPCLRSTRRSLLPPDETQAAGRTGSAGEGARVRASPVSLCLPDLLDPPPPTRDTSFPAMRRIRSDSTRPRGGYCLGWNQQAQPHE